MDRSEGTLPEWLDPTILNTALQLCVNSYDYRVGKDAQPGDTPLPKDCVAVKETIFEGGILGFVQWAEDTAYVVFRGTEMTFPNLFLTNFQAVTHRHWVLDDELIGSRDIPYQGGKFREVLPGKVHQGFARAASRLWYGSDLLVSPFVGESSEGAEFGHALSRRRWRHAALFALASVVGFIFAELSCFQISWALFIAVLTGACTSLFSAAFESGFLESLARISHTNMSELKALYEVRKRLASQRRVIFAGHSLGGSIATVCFAIYRAWLISVKRDSHQEVRLLTFGSPRLGSKEWIEAFEKQHAGQHVHFAHDRDWVPNMPPASKTDGEASRLIRCGPVGILLLAVNPIWRRVYEYLWRPQPYADQPATSKSVFILDSPCGWFALIGNHRIEAYRDSILRRVKQVRI